MLNESIRYKPGDDVEKWLNDLLCLDATSVQPILSGCPPPDNCDLYYINRYNIRCMLPVIEWLIFNVADELSMNIVCDIMGC